MADANVVPQIRFKGFTDPWEQRKLGELCEVNPTTVLPGSFEYVDLESVVGTDMVSHRREEKLTAPSRAQRLASFGDIFYQTVRPYQKNNYFYELSDKDYVFSTGYAQLRPLCDGRFLFSSLQREQFVSCVLEHCTGTSYPAINTNDLAALPLAVPSDIEEQRLEGSILKPIDALITLHQRKCDKLSVVKKALLEKMFPKEGEVVPEIRFKGFTDPWEQRKLGDVATIVGGGTPSTNNSAYWDGDIDWYSPAELGEQVYADRSVRRITQAGYDSCSATLLPAGKTILFTSRAGIGNTAILRRSACTNQGFQSLVMNDGTDVYFVYSMTDQIKKFAEQKASGSTFLEISGKGLAAGEFAFPSKDEQAAIGSMFKQLDSLITLHQRELETLKNVKKALLEKMFV